MEILTKSSEKINKSQWPYFSSNFLKNLTMNLKISVFYNIFVC